jgi:hypothetical protein
MYSGVERAMTSVARPRVPGLPEEASRDDGVEQQSENAGCNERDLRENQRLHGARSDLVRCDSPRPLAESCPRLANPETLVANGCRDDVVAEKTREVVPG